MATFKDSGIVLKTLDNKDYDKTLIVLLHKRGKTAVYAKGARKPGSKTGLCCEPFCVADFVLFEGRGFTSLAQADLIDNLYGLRTDYEVFCHAMYMLELSEKVMQPGMESGDVLRLLVRCLQAMAESAGNSAFVRIVYILKFLSLEGYSPELDKCCNCGQTVSKPYFTQGGLCCGACAPEWALRVTEREISGIRYILENDTAKLCNMNADPESVRALARLSEFFMEQNLEVKIKSAELI